MKYYHITPINNKASIIAYGLKSNNNEIFVFTKLSQAKHIAHSQIFITEYSIFEVNIEGVSGQMINDNVCDFGSQFQYRIEQDVIVQPFIKHLKDVSHNCYDLINETQKESGKVFGFSDEQIIGMMRFSPERTARFNEVNQTNYTTISVEAFNAKYSK